MPGYHCQSKAALVPLPAFPPPYPAPADTKICTREQASKNSNTTLTPDCKECFPSWPDPASCVLHKLLLSVQVARQQWCFQRLHWLKSFSWTTDWQLQSVSQYILLWLKIHILHFLPWATEWLGLILHHRHISARCLIDVFETFKFPFECQQFFIQCLRIKGATQDLIFNWVQTERRKIQIVSNGFKLLKSN